MGKTVRKLAATLGVLTAFAFISCSVISAPEYTVPSADRLPSGYWAYDAMGNLAADGLVPGQSARVFQGDRLFTRFEMARVLETVIDSAKQNTLMYSQSTLINSLTSEFKPELTADGFDATEKWNSKNPFGSRQGFQFSGYIRNMALSNSPVSNQNDNIGYRATARMDLSNNVFALASTANNRIDQLHRVRDTDTLDSAFVQGTTNNLVWSVGRGYMQWGPAYSGSLILSDNSPSMTHLYGSTDLDLGGFLGKYRVSEFVSQFESNGETLHLLGRRWERTLLHNQLYLGFTEALKTSETPGPEIFVMPFYLYQHLHEHTEGSHLNNLMAVDLLYERKNKTQLYGQFLADEMKSPSVVPGDHSKTPKKTGYILGFYTPKVVKGDKLTTFRLEYLYLDGHTYETNASKDNNLAYTFDGFILGHPFGPNANGFYMRSERELSKKASLTGEYYNLHSTVNDAPGNGKVSILSLQFAYDFTPAISASLRIAPFSTTPLGGSADSGVGYEFRTSFAF